ncbi:TonB-dependent receptor [bacterium]|nr:MAG: TonB-dependent receptor [bacterium]
MYRKAKQVKLERMHAAVFATVATIWSVIAPLTALAEGGTTITGTIVDKSGGLPVAGALVDLLSGTQRMSETTTARDGSFRFDEEPAGVYAIQITAEGYQRTQAAGIVVAEDARQVSFSTAIDRDSGSTGRLKVIGREAVASRGSLQTSATINEEISSDRLFSQNYARVGDALTTLPGVTGATSSAVGDDLSISIRGFNGSETAALLDGHPIGPIGSFGSVYDLRSGYDFQLSPFFGLRDTQVIFGSGATGLYGANTIAGAVNFETLNPTRHPHFLLKQGFGNDGKSLSAFEGTGTTSNGKLGYALVHAVQGTYGNFAPQQMMQRGLLGTDFTSANVAANTYLVSGAYLMRNDLLKLSYELDPQTRLTLTGYSATSWDDKSGNGDTDYNAYESQLYSAQQTVAAYGPGNSAPAGCSNGLVVKTDANPSLCATPQQYAQLAAGPAGGGPGPWQAIRNQDYHARLTRQVGRNVIAFDGFAGNYALDYNRNRAGGLDPTGTFYTGGFNTSFYRTGGFLISDDIAAEHNTFGFGYFVLHQRQTGDKFNYLLDGNGNVTAHNLIATPEYTQGFSSVFVRDQYMPSARLSLFGNFWLTHSTVTGRTTLDPRVSVIFRPTNQDVLRVTGGHSNAEPAPSLRFGPPNLNTTPQNLNPTCNGNQQTAIGSVSDPNLAPETSTDFEIGYGHRFKRGDTVQLNLYTANEQDALFGGTLAVSAIGSGAIPAFLLQQYYARIGQLCANLPNPILANLAVTTTYNAAQARYRGIEINGRYRLNRQFALDYMYDVQSAALLGVPDSVLANNVTVINGSQVYAVPLHKASLGLDYTSSNGLEARLDEFYTDGNNGFSRPAFTYANGSLSKAFGNTIVTLGIYNVFDDAVDTFGRIGLGVFKPENQFGTDTNAVQQQSERFGLPPRQFQLVVTQRI